MQPTNHRRFSALLPGEQERAIAALDAAAADLIAAGADETAIRSAARRHVGDLAFDELDTPVLLIEIAPPDPREAERRERAGDARAFAATWKTLPSYAAALDDCHLHPGRGPGDEEECALMLCTVGERSALPLPEGLKLLSGPDSPARALAERRARLAKVRSDHQERKRAEAAAQKAESERRAEWQRVNGLRAEAWDRMPRELQLLHVVADRLPKYADLVRELQAVVKAFPDGRTVQPPESWFARPATTAGGLPSGNGAAVTSEVQR
jgi:hypothetical protein